MQRAIQEIPEDAEASATSFAEDRERAVLRLYSVSLRLSLVSVGTYSFLAIVLQPAIFNEAHDSQCHGAHAPTCTARFESSAANSPPSIVVLVVFEQNRALL